MPVSVDYVARETASNLWRNRLMTIAAVLTVAVSLSLVGVSLLLRQGVAHATAQWRGGVGVEVFMQAASPAPARMTSQQSGIDDQLVQLPYVKHCLYRSQVYDYNEARTVIDPTAFQALSVGTTPSSLRCTLTNPNSAQLIAKQFGSYPGVLSVQYPEKQIHTMETVTGILQAVFLALAVVLLLSASVLILNTIRLAIFARRREVAVMKLVGATNWFIRVPFMCEGVVQGVVGAVVAAMVVIGLHVLLDSLAGHNNSSVFYAMRIPPGEVAATAVVVAVIGVVIGALGSALGIRRFLDA
ncbi:MAG TPA: permease-like cell division protein FtsX [Acidimicrobiales bacterium]|nr:permease-like cell division protein FtsX [Acidimicrobiales bacterium]